MSLAMSGVQKKWCPYSRDRVGGGVLMLMSWGGEMGVLMSSAISGVQKIWCPYHRDRVGVG